MAAPQQHVPTPSESEKMRRDYLRSRGMKVCACGTVICPACIRRGTCLRCNGPVKP